MYPTFPDPGPFWSDEAVEARRLSAGAVFVPVPEPTGLIARLKYRHQRNRLFRRSHERYEWRLSYLRRKWNEDYAAGRVDLNTGGPTDGAVAEAKAIIGTFTIPDGVPDDAWSVDVFLTAFTKEAFKDQRGPAEAGP